MLVGPKLSSVQLQNQGNDRKMIDMQATLSLCLDPLTIFYISLLFFSVVLSIFHNAALHGNLEEDRAKSKKTCVHLHFLVFLAQCDVRKIYCRLNSVYLSMIGMVHSYSETGALQR